MHLSLTAVLPDFSLLPQPFFFVFTGIFGALIGSFLNVVIHRLPREQSIVLPSSRCPSCGAAIAFYDNVPVLSYLMLGGRCRSCKINISARYPAVEALTALLWLAVAWRDGLTFALPFDLIFVTAITALIFIDAEHMILPNAITYPGIAFSLVARLAIPYLMGAPHFDDLPMLLNGVFAGFPLWGASLAGALIGALVGGGSLWLMGWTWEKLRGIEAMGLGDVKMMFMVGAYLGWRLTILNIFLGVFSGSLIGIGLMLRQGKRNMQMLLPFGVFLGIGAIAALLFGSQIVDWYAGQFYR
ncbi:MAG TPA: prepilin peptidase [Pyrinomonadaceae bacterium]|jgi:leader peptidase (prepilin peptidase)/N-methyltransferase|nr:prepilin peptidase [Pyrinomonadaceae bacterium]